MMTHWCLYIRHHSNKAYEVLRDAGLFLPPKNADSQCRCRKLKTKKLPQFATVLEVEVYPWLPILGLFTT